MRYLVPMLIVLASAPAFAQQYYDPNGAPVPATNLPGGAAAPSGDGALLMQLQQLQEQNRNLRGQLEQSQYQSQQNSAEMKKMSDDFDYRLQQLEQKNSAPAPEVAPAPAPAPAPVTPAPAAAAPKPAPAPAPAHAAPKVPDNGYDVNAGASNVTPGEPPKAAAAASYQPDENAPAAAPAKTGFSSAREAYNFAYKQLNDAKYADAAASFGQFVKDYPKDVLVPNAYYWMGESYYARRDFKNAAGAFRQGYEADPKSQKAADNLLKLSLSLANMKRLDEACIVLKQVSAQYKDTNKPTSDKADSEFKRLSCS